jgi:HPt (histidine-containing phosphotransfer) domain-containing protein
VLRFAGGPIARGTESKRVAMREQSEMHVGAMQRGDVSQPAWNVGELLERLDGDETFLCELLTIFRQDSQALLLEAKNALLHSNLTALEKAAHQLKGMLRNLLMNRAADVASSVEGAARQNDSRDLPEFLAQLENALEELRPQVDAHLAEVKA